MATTVEELAKEAQALRRKASSLKRQLRDVRVGEQQKKTDPPQEKTECFVCGEGNNMKECPLINSLIQGNGVGSLLGAAKAGHQTNPAVQYYKSLCG
jgi:hypothetical protein